MAPNPPRAVTNSSGRTQVGRPNATTLPPSLAQRFSDLGNYNLQIQATLNIIVFKTNTAANFPLYNWLQETNNILGHHSMTLDVVQGANGPDILNYNGGDIYTKIQIQKNRKSA